MSWWKAWQKWWQSWIGDRELERKIRTKLTTQGSVGDVAEFQFFKIAAIQRPGWVQVFHFCVVAPAKGKIGLSRENWNTFYGVVRQDERYNRTEIHLTPSRTECAAVLNDWSKDLIKARR
jgi:hypothetical protein